MRIGLKSDIGGLRDRDEDSLAVIHLHPGVFLFMLADGMGGLPCGEIASHLTIKASREFLVREIPSQEKTDFRKLIEGAVEKANQEILLYESKNPSCQGLGSTLVLGILQERKLLVGNMGDSRLYIINDKEIKQITEDHTTDLGALTRVVGYNPDTKVDIFELNLKPQDMILLCCDGLTDILREKEIHEIALKSEDLQQACNKLIELANSRGAPDNVSLILAR